MTLAHVMYALGATVILVAMLFRKGVIIPSLIATFAVGWAYKGGFLDGIIAGISTIYNASIMAAKELFGIVLLIAFMVAMLNSLKQLGADHKMIAPVQKLMVNGHVAYWVLVISTAILSTLFWPTPAIPLVAAILMPAALRAGLPPMGIAIAVTLAGQGMALAADALMQVAPSISAKAAGIPNQVNDIWSKSIVLSLIIGSVSTMISYLMVSKTIQKTETSPLSFLRTNNEIAATAEPLEQQPLAGLFAILTMTSFALVIVAMLVFNIKGGDAGALIGGTAIMIMLISSFAKHKTHAFEQVTHHLTDGFAFAIKIMGPIIPIAAFFFLGGQEQSAVVFGKGAPGFLFDLVGFAQNYIPHNELIASLGVMIVGILCGVDGSGFAGLPITGALSGALSKSIGTDPTLLASLGQMGSVWSGGGTFIAWSSLVAVAGFAGVSAVELARRNFLPVMSGLILATLIAVLMW